ncbi:phage tail tape measure protein [Streptomyces sp. NPDC047028]|uniref:phage tail tape measure protein n=1 Tax=Streptomyces sp. NPDC047028 TaxID=3155793 RepID=UPI0033CCAB3E
MASDTSLVFNLVARDQASEELGSLQEKFSSAGTAIGAALGVGVGASFVSAMDVEAANDKLAAQLGVGQAEAAKLAKVSANVYKNAWGESTEDVNDAIRGVYQNIGDVSKAEGGLQGVTTKVIALRDTFGQDLEGVTAAVGQMMKTGLAKNADEALDIVTKGFQKGVNKADDFLDTLNEYGVQFKALGLNGQMATGLLSQGLKGGARDADLVADSLKEFNLRARDITSTAPAGFKALGLNAKQMAADVAKGGPKATAALQKTLDALRKYPDSSKKASIAASIFGTQSEDMQKALMSLDPAHAVQALGKVKGATDKMTDTLGNNPKAALESFQRSATVATTQVAGKFIQFAMKNKAIFGPLAGILAGVAVAVLAVSAAQKVYAAYTAIASAAQTIWNAEIWASTAALLANPMTWIVIGIIALIAAIVLIATKTHWFQDAWKAMTQAVSVAWTWVVGMVKQGWDLLVKLFMNFTLVGLIMGHWNSIKHGTTTAWNAVVNFVKAIPGKIVQFFLNWTLPGLIIKHWNSIKSNTVRIATGMVNWLKGLPGQTIAALASLGGRLYATASSAFNRFKSAAVSRGTSAVNWVRGLPGRARAALGSLGNYLYNSGRSLIAGFVNGIKSMASAPANAVSGVLSKARNYLPFSPAKVGPFSGRGWTLYSGHSLMKGLAQGIQDSSGEAQTAMTDALGATAAGGRQAMAAPGARAALAAPLNAPGANVLVIRYETAGAEDDLHKLMRKITRVKGRGNVQTAFGQ